MTTQTNDIQLKLRIPPGLKKKLASSAHRNQRSMNAEAVAALTLTLLSENLTIRLHHALGIANGTRIERPLSPSLIAEMIGEPTARSVEMAFDGIVPPTFELLDRIASVLEVDAYWLKHGVGKPRKEQAE